MGGPGAANLGGVKMRILKSLSRVACCPVAVAPALAPVICWGQGLVARVAVAIENRLTHNLLRAKNWP
jgi:hypothetical protein